MTTASRWTCSDDAEVILVGASRTSKTPTCVYLAIRGMRAANVPLVPGIPLPPQLLYGQAAADRRPVGVADRLVQVRRNRLNTLGEVRDTAYVDVENVRCGSHGDAASCSNSTAGRRSMCRGARWKKRRRRILNLLADRREEKP